MSLDIQVTVSSGLGTLDLTAAPYDLGAESFAEVNQTWRRKQVTNPHVEGEFTVHAERENTVTPLAVYVQDTTRAATRVAVEVLKDALSQLQFTLTYRLDDTVQTWLCEVADFTEDTQHAFLHEGLTLIKAQIPRRPGVVYTVTP